MKRHLPRSLVLLTALLLPGPLAAQDGPGTDMGPIAKHELTPKGTGQDVLVIHVQADDYRILAGGQAALDTAEDAKRASTADWFDETSWGDLTLDFTRRPTGGAAWYTLPEALTDYVFPGGVQPMVVRSAAAATATNPTPAASVAAAASAAASGGFEAADAGDYWYAVAAFRNGSESTLTKIGSAVTVAAGDEVELTITRAAAADADSYLIYRTSAGATNADGSFIRIGAIDVTGASDSFTDGGLKPNNLAHQHSKLLEHAMEAADADVADFEAFDAVIAVIFSPFLRGQAAGAVTFDVNGTPLKIQTINMSTSTGFGRYAHEMGHWIGLPDLYGIADSVGSWDTMACACDGQYSTWLKDYLLEYIVEPGNVIELERPAPGDSDSNQNFVVQATELEENLASRYTALKIKSSDTVHYYIEGRDHVAGFESDQATPSENILITEAIDVLPMGIIPKRNVKLLTALDAGDPTYKPDPNVEITFQSINAGSPESYNVNVKLKAQPQPDLKITPWSPPPWETNDIWVDSEREGGGFQTPASAVPLAGNGEHAWVNHVNRVWAKVTNVGDGPAQNVQVVFRVNTPGGMGAAGQFVDLVSPAPIDLAAGASKAVYAEWTPTVDGHTCIEVEIAPVAGESDPNNNFAQENVDDFYSGSNSPWQTVKIPADVANPFDTTQRVELEIDGLPNGWRAELDHKWVTLDAKGRKMVEARIFPPEQAPECTSAELNVYGLTQIDDYIQVYGGFSPTIHLANPIRFRWNIKEVSSQGTDEGATFVGYRVTGCTMPAQPGTEIAIEFVGPGGARFVAFATTDAAGCFDTTVQLPVSGGWTAQAYFKGNECKAPTESEPIEFPGTGVVAGLGPLRYLGIFTGSNWPQSEMSDDYDPGVLYVVQGEWRFYRNYRFGLQVGLHEFDAEPATSLDNLEITNVSLIARLRQPLGSYHWFWQAGVGGYLSNHNWDLGYQAGFGLEADVTSKVSLAAGATYHSVNRSSSTAELGDLEWIDAYLGFFLSLP